MIRPSDSPCHARSGRRPPTSTGLGLTPKATWKDRSELETAKLPRGYSSSDVASSRCPCSGRDRGRARGRCTRVVRLGCTRTARRTRPAGRRELRERSVRRARRHRHRGTGRPPSGRRRQTRHAARDEACAGRGARGRGARGARARAAGRPVAAAGRCRRHRRHARLLGWAPALRIACAR